MSTARPRIFGGNLGIVPVFQIAGAGDRVDGAVKNFKAHAMQIFLVELDNLVKSLGVDGVLRLLEYPVLFLDDPRTNRARPCAVTLKALF